MFAQTPRMPSQMQHRFSEIPSVSVPRSSFRRPAEVHTAHQAGFLYPFYVDEVLPGDTHNVQAKILSRLTTQIKPFMSNLYFDTFFFFVPNRLVWDNWEKFNGAQDNPNDSTSFTLPLMYVPASTGWAAESLQDFLNYGRPGIAGNNTATYSVHNLVGRGYNLIFNQFFRDENLQNSAQVDKGNGPDNPANYVLRRRGKRHDYFTSALPWPQKGPAASISIGGTAPVYGTGLSLGLTDGSTNFGLRAGSGGSPLNPVPAGYNVNVGTATGTGTPAGSNLAIGVVANAATSGLIADLSTATAISINAFRQTFQIQMLLENDARGGTRYVEILLAHFGVISPDFRLQRPEYLGGGSLSLMMQTVPQTSLTSTTPQGNLAAFSLFSGKHGFVKSFVEHGYVIGLFSVRSDLSYQQGVERHYLRRTRYDYYWPSFAHLGEQVIYNQEIFQQGLSGTTADAGTWGYQERSAEYRYKNSIVTGKMRSDHAQSLDVWHLAQEFANLPALGGTFIEENPPIARVVAVDPAVEPPFQTNIYLDIKSARPMPVYSVPGLVTRL